MDLKYEALYTIYRRGVFTPTITYAAARWVDLCTESNFKILKAAQRKVLISWESLYVVAGAAPVDILLKEFATQYNAQRKTTARIGNAEIPAKGKKKRLNAFGMRR